MKRSHRRALAVTLAAGLPVLSGCALFSPATTLQDYEPANGVSVTVGDVEAINLLVVGEKGAEGLVSGALVNNGSTAQTIRVQAKSSPQPVDVQVKPGALVTIGGAGSGATVLVGKLAAAPGGMVDIVLSSPSGGQVTATVPVLSPTREYATVTPTSN